MRHLREIRDFSSLVLISQILWHRQGKAVKWDLLTLGETLFFGKQPERTSISIGRAWQQEQMPPPAILSQMPGAQSGRCKIVPFSFGAQSLWSEGELLRVYF